jgi:apolipoprotein N-acyltransferase
MAGLALLNWLAVPLLAPFGHSAWGASDALKFMSMSGLPWYLLAVCVVVASLAVILPSAKYLANQIPATPPSVAPRS